MHFDDVFSAASAAPGRCKSGATRSTKTNQSITHSLGLAVSDGVVDGELLRTVGS